MAREPFRHRVEHRFAGQTGALRPTGVAQSDIGEFKGRDLLGLSGTNGTNFYEGGTPLFDLDTYADLGTTDTFMPY